MKKLIRSICILMTAIFAFIGFTVTSNGKMPYADSGSSGSAAEDEEYVDEEPGEISQSKVLKTYYEWDNYTVTENETDNTNVLTVEDANGNSTEHVITDNKLTSSTYDDRENGETVTNTYDYDSSGNVTAIDNNNRSYGLDYDADGNFISGTYNGHSQYTNTYDSDGNLILTQFANNDTISYTYSGSYLTEIKHNGVTAYSFTYAGDIEGELTVTQESHGNGDFATYEYTNGNLVCVSTGNGSTTYTYDDDGNLTSRTDDYFSETNTTTYGAGIITNGPLSISYTRDDKDRVTERTLSNSDTGVALTTSVTYSNYDGRPATYSTPGYEYTYSYDANGNLTGVTVNDSNTTYEYSSLNLLIAESNDANNYSYTYAYDTYGNIISKKDALTDTELLNVEYDQDNKLIKKSGVTISYDAVGNPLNYNGYTLKWENGKLLSSMTKGDNRISYSYNTEGYREIKNVNGLVTRYVCRNGHVSVENNSRYKISYGYDEDNELIFFKLDAATNSGYYYYVKDGLNNIVAITNAVGETVVTYSYDAYGNILSIQGSLADSVGVINPYRYRSYRYDNETGFYYLNSRYYDPEVCRFISADDISMVSKYALGSSYNLYAYASNNPIKYTDGDGNFSIVIGGMTIGIGMFIIFSAAIMLALFAVVFPRQFRALISICYTAFDDLIKAALNVTTSFWDRFFNRNGNNHSHHIVARKAPQALEGRIILKDVDIDPEDDMRNRVDLKARFHHKLHTNTYYRSVNAALHPAIGYKKPQRTIIVENILNIIRFFLSSINKFK